MIEIPIFLGFIDGISTVLLIAAIVSASQKIKQGQDQKKEANRQARQLEKSGQQEAQLRRQQAAVAAASAEASVGASGFVGGVGSAAVAPFAAASQGLADASRVLSGVNAQSKSLKRSGKKAANAANTSAAIQLGLAFTGAGLSAYSAATTAAVQTTGQQVASEAAQLAQSGSNLGGSTAGLASAQAAHSASLQAASNAAFQAKLGTGLLTLSSTGSVQQRPTQSQGVSVGQIQRARGVNSDLRKSRQ